MQINHNTVMSSTQTQEGRQQAGGRTSTATQPQSSPAPETPAQPTRPPVFNQKTSKAALLAELTRLNSVVTGTEELNRQQGKQLIESRQETRRLQHQVEELKYHLESHKKALEQSEAKTQAAKAEAKGERAGFTSAIQIFASQGRHGAQLQRRDDSGRDGGFAQYLREVASTVGADPDELASLAERMGLH